MPDGENLWTKQVLLSDNQSEIALPTKLLLALIKGAAVPTTGQITRIENPPVEATLDVQHLSRQTFGDVDLERDILSLFREQCLKLAPLIAGHAQLPSRVDAAHTLKGGARAVGAVAVARIADEIECALRHHGELACGQIEDLALSITEIRQAIDRRLACDS